MPIFSDAVGAIHATEDLSMVWRGFDGLFVAGVQPHLQRATTVPRYALLALFLVKSCHFTLNEHMMIHIVQELLAELRVAPIAGALITFKEGVESRLLDSCATTSPSFKVPGVVMVMCVCPAKR